MASTIWEHLDASKPVDMSNISNNCRTAELAKHDDHQLHDRVLCYLQNNQRFKRFAEYVHRSPALSEKLQTWSRVKIMMIMIMQAGSREKIMMIMVMQKKSSQLLAPAILKAASLVTTSFIFSASNQRSAPHFFQFQFQIGLGINHVFALILSHVQWRSLNHHINYLNETPPNYNEHHPGHSVHSYKRGFQTSPWW